MYKVVKFIVKVRLMENNVNSHVGKVIVVNVMNQYKAPGSTRRTLRMTRASRPKVEDGVGFSTALIEAAAVGSMSVTL